MAAQIETVAEAMPKLISVLSFITFGLVGVVWKAHQDRIRAVEERTAAVEEDLDGKADGAELTRQRDNVGKLYTAIDAVKQDMNDRFARLTQEVNDKHLKVTESMHGMEQRLMTAMRETVTDRRERPR